MQNPIVFIRIGWMKYYRGPQKSDPLRAENFSFFRNNNVPLSNGHEQWNFAPLEGKVYGYVPRSSGINITKLGASPKSEAIQGVTVVFTALDPFAMVLKVVGWYENATVFRHIEYKHKRGNLTVESSIEASFDKATVLPVPLRTVTIPAAQRIKGGFGQSPIWYAEKHPEVIERVRSLIKSYKRHDEKKTSRPPRNSNPERRKEVEDFAMRLAMDYFEETEDVSSKNYGWDINSYSNNQLFQIEVKGISANRVHFELTPNEYDALQAHKETYVLFVVTGALTKAAKCHIFRYSNSTKWISDQGDKLTFKSRTGAVAKVAP